jgi:hypothetical protein
MRIWLQRWTTDTHILVLVGQAKGGCHGWVWFNHRGAPKCRLQRWSVGTSKSHHVGSLLHEAQRLQEACGCVRKVADRGSWWSVESQKIQPLRGVLALCQSSTQDQASWDLRQQDQDEALVPPQWWEEDHHRINCSKMICMPHIYVIMYSLID